VFKGLSQVYRLS